MTGIGIQVAGLAKICHLTSYHLGIIFSLAQLSTTTHIVTLFALREFFTQHKLLRNIRVSLMAINAILLLFTASIYLMVIDQYDMPVKCIGFSKSGPKPWAILFLLACLILPSGFGVSGVFFSGFERYKVLQQFWKFAQWMMPVTVVSSCGMFVVLNLETDALGRSPWVRDPPSLMEGTEREWTYGQMFPLLLLFLPLLSALEIYSGMPLRPLSSPKSLTHISCRDTRHSCRQPDRIDHYEY